MPISVRCMTTELCHAELRANEVRVAPQELGPRLRTPTFEHDLVEAQRANARAHRGPPVDGKHRASCAGGVDWPRAQHLERAPLPGRERLRPATVGADLAPDRVRRLRPVDARVLALDALAERRQAVVLGR